MSKIPDWAITGLIWIIGGVGMYFLLFSCSVYQPLDGLCYTDNTGTYVCLKEEETIEKCENNLFQNKCKIA